MQQAITDSELDAKFGDDRTITANAILLIFFKYSCQNMGFYKNPILPIVIWAQLL